MPLLDGPSLGGNARHVLRQYAEESALARGRAANAAGTEEFGGGCLRGRYNNLREVIQNNPSLVVVPSIINAGSLFVQRPICRTNYLPNNSMAGATGGVLPTNWSIASLPAGITVSYSASGTAVAADGTSVNYIDVTVSGTAGASGFLNIRPNPSSSTIAAFVGQTYNTSVYLQLISGSVASISPTWQLQELNLSQTFLQGSNIGGLGSLVVGGQFDRYNVSRVLTDSATAFVTCRWGHSFVSGTTYSYTLRIGSPQLERFSVPTPMIATSTGAVTRLNESTNVVGLPPDFTVSRNTTATRVTSSGLIESVASGVPRIDWLGQSCPGLLVEASGTNFARWVNQMTAQDIPAASGGMTITTGSTDFLAPDGTSGSITKYVGGAASGATQYAYYTGGIIVTASGQHTFSLFVKRGATNPLTFCALSFVAYTGGSGTSSSYFNLASGTALTAGASVQDYGDGWYRLISAPYTIASGDLSGNLIFSMAEGNGDVSFPASGALNLTAYIWGAQLETSSIATTYIPTTTTTASRAADVISASGALVSGLIGQTEGTLYAEIVAQPYNNAFFPAILQVDDGADNQRFAIFINPSGGIRVRFNASGVNTNLDSATPSILVAGQTYKIAAAFNFNGSQALYINGVFQASLTVTAGPFTATLNRVMLGHRTGIVSPFLIRAAALYTTRLSNDQLAELTRL